MSGGTWGYKGEHIRRSAEEITLLLKAVAETERIVDWAVSGDSNQKDPGKELFRLWHRTFEDLYGDPF
jgi:hypothetical protein